MKKVDVVDVDGVVQSRRFRSAYDHVVVGRSYAAAVGEESRTKQEFKDSCDINKIVDHFTKTGRLDGFRQAQGAYVDFEQLPGNYQESLNMINAARDAFMLLPAKARAHFDNDIGLFLANAAMNPDAVFGVRDADGTLVAPPQLEAVPTSPKPDSEPTPPQEVS